MAALCRGFVRLCSSTFPRKCHLKSVNIFQSPLSTCQVCCASSMVRSICTVKPRLAKETATVHFIEGDGTKHTVNGTVGDNLLDIIIDNDADIDGFGACEGTLACSTCHVIFKQKDFDKLPEKPTDEELDMLDLAYELTDTSRLGCQVILTKDMDGLEVRLPSNVSDARG